MAQRPARWSRLARRAGRDLSCLPSRRFRELRERKDMRHHLRRRLSGIMVAPVEALAQMPESLDTAEAAPLMCAGVTTFNSLRHGGASVILATAPSGKAMSALVGGLGVNGTMVVVGASMDPIEVSPNQLLFGKKGIKGWAGGIPTDSQDTLRFAEMAGVRPMIEKFPLAKAAEGYARMMSGKAEFRVVLTT